MRRAFRSIAVVAAVSLQASAAAGIDEQGFVKIGGIEQWIAIQGDDVATPVLLYLHGGPAEAQSPTSFDARKLRFDPELPFFVIQGRDDHITSNEAAERFVAALPSKTKAYVPIDGGHFACFTDAKQFVAALVKHVKPFAR